MIPFSPVLLTISLIQYALTGMLLGLIAGSATALVLKTGRQGILKDAVIGALAFVLILIIFAFLPWPQNTIAYRLDHASVTSTMSHYQHPLWLAYPAAIILPILYESYRRFKRIRSE